MNHPKHCSDDPQFTAYALGQLDGPDRVVVEAALRADPVLRDEVEEIRAAASMFEAALAAEAISLPVGDEQPAAAGAISGQGDRLPTAPAARVRPAVPAARREVWAQRPQSLPGKIFQFPRFYYVAGGLAAAFLAVFVALQRVEYDTREDAEATMARIARARQAADDPATRATALVAISMPTAAPEDAGPAGQSARPRKSAVVGWRGGAAGAAGVAAGARAATGENPFVRVAENPRSSFPIDVDPAGYGLVRRAIRQGSRPPIDAVRIEEMLNYFPFRYPAPKGDARFAAALEVATAPWSPAHRLVRIGLKGREAEETPAHRTGGPTPALARDVRIQVEFNPARVVRFRLIGYDTQAGQTENGADDGGDADDVGAGHAVTALYEIVPVGADGDTEDPPSVRVPLKYQGPAVGAGGVRAAMAEAGRADANHPLLTVTVWYRVPDESGGRWLEFPLADDGAQFEVASPDFRFAAAVAQYGMILRGSHYKGSSTLGDVLAWAAAALPEPADDPGGLRFDFLDLVRRTQSLAE